MRTIGLPLRIGADGQLDRVPALEALVSLFRTMATSAAGGWPHAPWFGLAELFAEANLAREDQHQIADALATALRELGVDWVRVESVRSAGNRRPGERRFDITLISADGRAHHTTFAS